MKLAPWLPPSALTFPKVLFTLSPATDRSFLDLNHHFTTAPILIHLNPSRQFVVEVDASDVRVGAILSQRSALDLKLHPCAAFSQCLNATERNYVGNRELLAVKLALEGGRHWLEGAELSFIVWTDHKNLEYLHNAKRPTTLRWPWQNTDIPVLEEITHRTSSMAGGIVMLVGHVKMSLQEVYHMREENAFPVTHRVEIACYDNKLSPMML